MVASLAAQEAGSQVSRDGIQNAIPAESKPDACSTNDLGQQPVPERADLALPDRARWIDEIEARSRPGE
jgi:hypothetical protein